jgi:phenylacetate-CoA ligase
MTGVPDRSPWRTAVAWTAMITYDVLRFGGHFSAGLYALHRKRAWTRGAQQHRLRETLDHASTTVPFYQAMRLGVGASLSAFPVVTKSDIRADPKAFTSSRYADRDLIQITTSGSTGTPFRIGLDRGKLGRRTSEILYFNSLAGFRVGQPHTLHAVGAKKNPWRVRLQNQRVTDPSVLDRRWLDGEIDALRGRRTAFYIGYVAAIRALSQHVLDIGLDSSHFRLEGIVATAERLDEGTRMLAQRAFGCSVISRYSSLETGVLSQECRENTRHHLNEADYFVEILDLERDAPAAAGSVGRVVVTDLWARGVPLIRYDMGDLATPAPEPCGCGRPGRTLERIDGRQVENVQDVDGRWISWVAINDLMWRYPAVSAFQFVQHAAGAYEMLIVGADASDADRLRASLLAIVGGSARLEVRRVASIPPLSSGKRQYIVNRTAGGRTTSP